MLEQITYHTFFGIPVMAYLGMLTLSSFLFTALIGYLNYKGIHKIPFKYHHIMAGVSICLALIHGTLGLLAYIK